ncbi:hypothetical protein E2C01_000377 [Portunus trituberculatus]|uniref:Uncharacterized protein n=1 Tax=Portunus trituberculatus TaxID=210409 RepID=A0A5B7CF22_PORTR|nr:hypothetical protein [Portunus trituberculatus]
MKAEHDPKLRASTHYGIDKLTERNIKQKLEPPLTEYVTERCTKGRCAKPLKNINEWVSSNDPHVKIMKYTEGDVGRRPVRQNWNLTEEGRCDVGRGYSWLASFCYPGLIDGGNTVWLPG